MRRPSKEVAALTGFVGFCPMCALVGRRLDSRKPSSGRADDIDDAAQETLWLLCRLHRARALLREYLLD